MQIYLARNQQQAGPYTLKELNLMLKDGQVILTDLMWHQGMETWKTVGEMTQQQYYYQPIDPRFEAEQKELIQMYEERGKIFAELLDKEQQKLEQLASIAHRFVAKLIDMCLWIPAMFCLTAFMSKEQTMKVIELQNNMHTMTNEQMQTAFFSIIPTVGWIAMLVYVFSMLFLQGFLLAKSGQSLGKKVMNIQVVDAYTYEPVSMFRAFTLRSVLFIFLNALFFPLPSLVDYIFAIGRKRQALHDKLTRTVVVYKK